MVPIVADCIGSLLGDGPVALVAVPASKKGVAYRGFDQMQLVAKALRRQSNGRIQVFRMLASTLSYEQKLMDAQQRRKIRFGVNERKKRKLVQFVHEHPDAEIYVIDDVSVTGSSMEHAMDLVESIVGRRVLGVAFCEEG